MFIFIPATANFIPGLSIYRQPLYFSLKSSPPIIRAHFSDSRVKDSAFVLFAANVRVCFCETPFAGLRV